MEIKVYGTGCASCEETEKRISKIVKEKGLDITVHKVTDLREILKAGVLSTPAVSVDNELKISGSIPSKEEIEEWLA